MRPPSSLRVFLGALMEMAGMIALPVGAIATLTAMLLWWPGVFVGLPILLVLAWLCHKQAARSASEHRW